MTPERPVRQVLPPLFRITIRVFGWEWTGAAGSGLIVLFFQHLMDMAVFRIPWLWEKGGRRVFPRTGPIVPVLVPHWRMDGVGRRGTRPGGGSSGVGISRRHPFGPSNKGLPAPLKFTGDEGYIPMETPAVSRTSECSGAGLETKAVSCHARKAGVARIPGTANSTTQKTNHATHPVYPEIVRRCGPLPIPGGPTPPDSHDPACR